MDQNEVDSISIAAGSVPFQLQLDKPVPSKIIISEWNPEKDLLVMVSDDFKIFLHRFNWQRLWTVSPGKCITSICWRPDGKMFAVGYEDGSITLHDVENGKLLRTTRSHCAPIVCLNWEEDAQLSGKEGNPNPYEDRTPRFFPPAPRNPQMPGLGSGDAGLSDGHEDTFGELSCSVQKRFNVLCSGDKNGDIGFSIFGIFPIGKINLRNMGSDTSSMNRMSASPLMDASLHKLSLSRNLSRLTVLALGRLPNDGIEGCTEKEKDCIFGMHLLYLDTSIFHTRRNELYQVALHASNVEDLIGVIRVSLSVIHKQWSDTMSTFHDKFSSLSSLIINNGLDSSLEEEFMSLLLGARSSPPLHQFLVQSLGEAGLKRITKAVDGSAKDINRIIREHLQPAAEIIGFRIGELRGLSKWRSRYHDVGLDEKVIENATEKAAMFLVQVERFLRVLAIVAHELQNFFNWLMKCIKLLSSESTATITQVDIELVVTFLKFHFNWDPVMYLLEVPVLFPEMDVDENTLERLEELKAFGGFADSAFLKRTLAKEFHELEDNFKEVFTMPFSAVSKRILCAKFSPLYPVSSASCLVTSNLSSSISYYKDEMMDGPIMDYICLTLPDECLDMRNSIALIRRYSSSSGGNKCTESSFQGLILRIPSEYKCVDLALYKDGQLVLLLNETMSRPETTIAGVMMFRAGTLPFATISTSTSHHHWKIQDLMAFSMDLDLASGKLRKISQDVSPPLAVSASRGVACVFTGRKRALVFILDEDEDENE